MALSDIGSTRFRQLGQTKESPILNPPYLLACFNPFTP